MTVSPTASDLALLRQPHQSRPQHRLSLGHVQAGSANGAGLQRGDQVILADVRPARLAVGETVTLLTSPP